MPAESTRAPLSAASAVGSLPSTRPFANRTSDPLGSRSAERTRPGHNFADLSVVSRSPASGSAASRPIQALKDEMGGPVAVAAPVGIGGSGGAGGQPPGGPPNPYVGHYAPDVPREVKPLKGIRMARQPPTLAERHQAATKLQAAWRGYRTRNFPDPENPNLSVDFVSWRNTTAPTQAEHMTVGYRTGGSAQPTVYKDFRQGTGARQDIPSYSAVNRLTGQSAVRPYYNLAYGEHSPHEHQDRFLARPLPQSQVVGGGRQHRYDATQTLTAHLTPRERLRLSRETEARRRTGVFHLFGEAPDPPGRQVTRCMTPLEQVARMRGIELEPGNPSVVANQFHQDQPQTGRLAGSVTAPRQVRYQVENAPRESALQEPVPTTNTTISEEAKEYWKGNHNV